MRAIHLLFAFFVVIVLAPQLYFFLLTPPDHTFLGFFINARDTLSYKMWASQYPDTLFADNLYNPQEEKLRFFNSLFFTEGIFLKLGVPFWLVDSLFKILFFGLYLLLLEKFVSLFYSGKDRNISILFIVLFASPSMIFLSGASIIADAYIFVLSAFHLLLQLFIFYLLLSPLSKRNTLLLFLALFLLFTTHPYSIIHYPIIILAYLAIFHKNTSRAGILVGATLLAVALSGLFLYWEMAGTNQERWTAYRFEYFDVVFLLLAFFPISITSLIGLFHIIKRRKMDRKYGLLTVWVLVVLFIVFLIPFLNMDFLPLQTQKLVVGLSLPLMLMSFAHPTIRVYAFRYRHVFFAYFLFSILSVVIAGVLSGTEWFYAKNDLLSAFSSVKEDPSIHLVLTSDRNSLISPPHTGEYSWPGHIGLTNDYWDLYNLSERAVMNGNLNETLEFCSEHPEAAVVTEKGEGLYDIITVSPIPGMEVEGDAAIIYCHSIR